MVQYAILTVQLQNIVIQKIVFWSAASMHWFFILPFSWPRIQVGQNDWEMIFETMCYANVLISPFYLRIGSSKNGTEFENGFKQVVQHKWFKGFDWEGLPEKEGPLLPSGSREFPQLLEYLK